MSKTAKVKTAFGMSKLGMSKRLAVRVGQNVYEVDVYPPYFKGSKYFAKFLNADIDSFEQSWPITKQDIVEYINEEYPELAV